MSEFNPEVEKQIKEIYDETYGHRSVSKVSAFVSLCSFVYKILVFYVVVKVLFGF